MRLCKVILSLLAVLLLRVETNRTDFYLIELGRMLLLLLLLLLSRFSCVQLCATPETAAHKAPPSLGFSQQEHWSGVPFPSPVHESEKLKVKSLSHVQLCATP